MHNRIIKRLVSIAMCISLVTSIGMISNATSINTSGRYNLGVYRLSGNANVTHNVSYIHYDGMAVGAHINSGLDIYKYTPSTNSNGYYFKTVNTNYSSTTHTFTSGTHKFELRNNTSKNVSIDISFYVS